MNQRRKVIAIYTDRLHYYRKNLPRRGIRDLNQYLTVKWRSWFENKVLRIKSKATSNKRSDPEKEAVYGSLRSCYRTTLKKVDSGIYGKPRLTRLDELFHVFKEELRIEIEKAKRRDVNERLIKLLEEEFSKVKRQAQLWNIRISRKLGLEFSSDEFFNS